jgi:hypothetical protein
MSNGKPINKKTNLSGLNRYSPQSRLSEDGQRIQNHNTIQNSNNGFFKVNDSNLEN